EVFTPDSLADDDHRSRGAGVVLSRRKPRPGGHPKSSPVEEIGGPLLGLHGRARAAVRAAERAAAGDTRGQMGERAGVFAEIAVLEVGQRSILLVDSG